MARGWRFVQPGANQAVVVLHDLATGNRIWIVSLDLVYIDHQGFHVYLHQKPTNMFTRWHWRRCVR